MTLLTASPALMTRMDDRLDRQGNEGLEQLEAGPDQRPVLTEELLGVGGGPRHLG